MMLRVSSERTPAAIVHKQLKAVFVCDQHEAHVALGHMTMDRSAMCTCGAEMIARGVTEPGCMEHLVQH